MGAVALSAFAGSSVTNAQEIRDNVSYAAPAVSAVQQLGSAIGNDSVSFKSGGLARVTLLCDTNT